MTKDLEVLLALKALVAAALPLANVRGFDADATRPERIGDNGCVVGHPGEPGEPEIDLSPLSYNYQHRLFLEVAAPDGEGGEALDAMLLTLGDAIAADRFLGGLVRWLDADAPERTARSTDTVASINWATVPVIAEYSTANPLG